VIQFRRLPQHCQDEGTCIRSLSFGEEWLDDSCTEQSAIFGPFGIGYADVLRKFLCEKNVSASQTTLEDQNMGGSPPEADSRGDWPITLESKKLELLLHK
jgi:hypothetical protein